MLGSQRQLAATHAIPSIRCIASGAHHARHSPPWTVPFAFASSGTVILKLQPLAALLVDVLLPLDLPVHPSMTVSRGHQVITMRGARGAERLTRVPAITNKANGGRTAHPCGAAVELQCFMFAQSVITR